jgi:hypothetical protein
MTYIVFSDHVECLRGGRMVAPGTEISDAVAKKNEPMINRGVLVKQESPKRARNTGKSAGEGETTTAAESPQEEAK